MNVRTGTLNFEPWAKEFYNKMKNREVTVEMIAKELKAAYDLGYSKRKITEDNITIVQGRTTGHYYG